MKTLSITLSLLLVCAWLAVPIEAQKEAPAPQVEAETAPTAAENAEPVETALEEDPMEAATAEPAEEEVVLMDARWAELACEAWNGNPTLTDELAAPGWAANNADRGYKVLQVYRTDCENSPWVELQIADQDSKALCVYGGPVQTEELVGGVDYVMHALTQRWQEMGAGNYGPMKGMMTGRLKFKGPKWEAMKNMGPFSSFLKLTGEVAADAATCPSPDVPA